MSNGKLTLTFIDTNSHGYLVVHRNLVHGTGVKVSEYSYYNPNTQLYFLEEDCDAPLVLNELKKMSRVEIDSQHQDDLPFNLIPVAQ